MPSNVIVEDIVHMYKAILYYSIVICCGMYEEHCLTASLDAAVALSLCQVQCVSVLPLLSYINLNIPTVLRQLIYKQIVGVVLFTNCRGLGLKFIAVPSCVSI